jgi:hypothetical protein
MNPRVLLLSSVEKHVKQKCRFLNLRDALTYYPNDKKLLGLTNRLHNYQAIRHDLRRAHNLLGEVIRVQNDQELLKSPYLFSAGWFQAVILYARWFKTTEKRPRFGEDFFDGDASLIDKHRYFIELRDKYIAHYEKEIIGKTEIYLTYSLSGDILELSPLCLEVYVKSKHDLFDLSKLIEFVHNKINGLVPKYEKELFEYIKSLPDFSKLFNHAKEVADVVESTAPCPYDYCFSLDEQFKPNQSVEKGNLGTAY